MGASVKGETRAGSSVSMAAPMPMQKGHLLARLRGPLARTEQISVEEKKLLQVGLALSGKLLAATCQQCRSASEIKLDPPSFNVKTLPRHLHQGASRR